MGRDAIAFEVPRYDDPHRSKPGAFYFVYTSSHPRGDESSIEARANSAAGICHACPCGCGVATILFFRGRGINGADEWDVTGSWPAATLSPSIGIGDRPNWHWHGYLHGGVFVER